MSAEPPQLYPAELPVKVMGRSDADLRATTQPIIERHMGPVAESNVRSRLSGDGNFIALTYVVRAESRAQLDALYRELTACKSVLMAL